MEGEEEHGRTGRRPTLRDVAERAGVTPMTASRSLNGSQNVSLKTRNQVMRVAREMGYRPNLAARALRTRRHGVVGFHSPELSMPLHLEVVLGAREALTREGYRVVLDTELPGDRYVSAAAVDGSLVMPFASSSVSAERHSVAESCVCIMRRPEGFEDADLVRWDQADIECVALRHLATQGYDRVAWLGYANAAAPSRLEAAAVECGLRPDSISTYPITDNPAEVEALILSLLSDSPGPQALLVISVIGTRLVLAGLRRAGVKIGLDLGFIGTEVRSQDWGQLLTPPMTAVVPPGFEMGAAAARQLILRMTGTAPTAPSERVVPTDFIVRGSTPKRSRGGRRR